MKRLSQTDLRNSSFSFIGSAKSESECEFTDESESRKRVASPSRPLQRAYSGGIQRRSHALHALQGSRATIGKSTGNARKSAPMPWSGSGDEKTS